MIKDRSSRCCAGGAPIEGMLAQHPELNTPVTAVGSDYLRLPAVARVRQPLAPIRASCRPASSPGDPQRVERAAKAVAFVSPLPSSIVSTWFSGGPSIR